MVTRKRKDYKDVTKEIYDVLHQRRNAIGEVLAAGRYHDVFLGLKGLKDYIIFVDIPRNMFDNLLEEILVIGQELSGDGALVLVGFQQHLKANELGYRELMTH